MATLQDAINKESMINVNIDPSNFVKILQKMNVKMKEMDRRIKELEGLQDGYLTKDRFYKEIAPINQIVKESGDRVADAVAETKNLHSQMEGTKENLTNLIDSKFNEMLFATSLETKSSIEGVNQTIDQFKQQFEEYKKETEEETQSNQEQANEESANMTMSIQTLGDKMQHLHSEFLRHCTKCENKKSIASAPVASANSVSTSLASTSLANEEVQSLANRISKLEQLAKLKGQLDEDAGKKADRVYDEVVKMVNEKLTKLQDSLQVALMSSLEARQQQAPPTSSKKDVRAPSDDQYAELWAVTNQNRSALLNTMTEQSLLSRKLDAVVTAMQHLQMNANTPPIEIPATPVRTTKLTHQLPKNDDIQQQILDADARLKEHRVLASTVDGLGDKMSIAIQDIMKIKNAVNKNEKDVRDVVLAIIDEFKLIRGNATGLENLPPLNLAKCVPSFFNNPSFTFGRDDDTSSQSSASNTERSVVNSSSHTTVNELADQETPHFISTIHEEQPQCRKISGLLHLVCRQEYQRHRADQLPDDEENVEENVEEKFETASDADEIEDFDEEEDEEPREDRSRNITATSSTATFTELQKKSSVSTVRGGRKAQAKGKRKTKIVYQADDAELRSMLAEFRQEKNELMTNLDRKVDRDMVERLFNKMRTIIHGMNEKVNQMAQMMEKFATTSDVESIAKVVTNLPKIADKSAGIKIGPECLFCGRARSQLAGQISPRTALTAAANSSVSTATNNGSTFVYGDGGAYHRGLMDSMPHFKLPSLKDNNKVIPA